MNLIEQIKADCENGTDGPWEVKYDGDTRLYMNGSCEMCNMTYYPWTPENPTDWERIARVPEMETALVAAVELVKSLEWVVANASFAHRQNIVGVATEALGTYRNAIIATETP